MCLGKAVKNGLSVWAPATYVGVLEEDLGSWLQRSRDLVIAAV